MQNNVKPITFIDPEKAITGVRRFANNSLMIIISHIANKAIAVVFIAFLARYLGIGGFGQYTFVFAFISFFSVIASFGMQGLLIREISRQKEETSQLMLNGLCIKAIMVLVSWTLLILITPFLNKPEPVNWAILIIGITLLPTAVVDTAKAVFFAHEIMAYGTIIDVIFRVVLLVSGLLVIIWDLGFISLILCSVLASIAVLPLTFTLIRRITEQLSLCFNRDIVRRLFVQACPFALTGIFVSIYYRVDVVMLSMMKGDESVGIYGAAYMLSESVLFISAAVSSAVFPIFSRLSKDQEAGFRFAYEKTFKLLLLLGLPIAMGTTVVSRQIIELVYGGRFEDSVRVLQVLIWAAPAIFLNSLLGNVLYASGKQSVAAVTSGLKIGVNVMLNLLLIPDYNYLGAGIATVATEIGGLIVYYRVVSNTFCRLDLIAMGIKPLIATLAMAVAVGQLWEAHIAFQVGTGVAVYVGIVILLKIFTPEEQQILKTLVNQR